MTFWDWLGTPPGVALVHAMTVLLVAVAAYVGELGRRESRQTHRELHDHISTCTTGSVPESAEHKM